MSHCSDLSDDMPINNSLLNPPSEAEKVRDLESKGERMMCSYVRVRTRLAALHISLPEELEQSAKRAYQEVETVDPNGVPADYSRKLGKLQRHIQALESGFEGSESVQSEGQSRQTTHCDAQLSPMLSGRAPNIRQQHQPPCSSAGPEGEEAQKGNGTCNVLAGDAGVQPGDSKCIP